MNDDEYIIDIVYNCSENKMLQKLASAYSTKFYNNKEIKNTIIQYAVSSYIEPDCFPYKTPINEIPDMILSNTNFINEVINKLSETQDLDKLIPDLIGILFNKIDNLPNEFNDIIYFQIETLLKNKNVLLHYAFSGFKFFEYVFRPRLCPDINNILILPKDKIQLFELSKHFDSLFNKVSDIILLFCKCKETRSKMIEWLYSFIEKNKGRKKTQPDQECSVDGIVLNFLGALLILCEPFLSIYSDKVSKINVEDINSNFISQCFDMTSKMVDYGFLTVLHKYKITSYRFSDDPDKEYILNAYHSQMGNKLLLHNLNNFLKLQLYILEKNDQKEEELIESIWKTVDYFTNLNMIDYDICSKCINFFIAKEITNPHLRCEIGRITSAILLLNLYPLNDEIIKKLLKLYGNMQNVDTQDKYFCRKEVIKCIELYDIKKLDDNILNEFSYGLLSESDTLTSKALDELLKLKVKLDNKEEIEEKYEQEVKTNFDIANDILLFLKKMTQLITKSFMDECSIKKCQTWWSFMIYRLIGPQCLKLKIDNATKYNFYPKSMLITMLTIFTNLKNEKIFEEVGKVGLLDENIFNKLVRILNRERLYNTIQINELKESLSKINITIETEEAPEEFYDSIMGTLMENPVKLPSGNIVDKITILQHLKNDSSDPFTRQELKEEDLVYDYELKKKINEWKK